MSFDALTLLFVTDDFQHFGSTISMKLYAKAMADFGHHVVVKTQSELKPGDAEEAHLMFLAYPALFPNWPPKIPVVARVSIPGAYKPGSYVSGFACGTDAIADRVAARDRGKRRVQTVPCIIEMAALKPLDADGKRAAKSAAGLPQDAFVAGQVGLMGKRKRTGLVCDAWDLLKPDDGIELILRGELLRHDGYHLPEKKPRVFAWTDRTADCYAPLDLLVHMSREEGFSRVLWEAGACGIPAVVSEAANNSGFVEDGVNGMILHEPDQKKLVAALRMLRDHPDMVKQMGEKAREKATAARLAGSDVAPGLDVLFRQVIADGRPAVPRLLRRRGMVG